MLPTRRTYRQHLPSKRGELSVPPNLSTFWIFMALTHDPFALFHMSTTAG